jgi:bifunctional non-homologous end joining protein LigD
VPLEEYRRKRDPRRTPEPVPETDPDPGAGPGTRFVIQEHHARALHWDVRLERDGVLASWAVPRGLPAEPGTLRLAVRTEDHPIEYLEFSGEIPRGEYGGGTMTVWDAGTYDTDKWTDREVAVVLHGRRARGRYVFVRTDSARRDGWLLRRSDPGRSDPGRPGGPAPQGHTPLPRDARPVQPIPGSLPRAEDRWLQVGFGGTRVVVRVDGGRVRLTDAAGAPVEADLRALGAALGVTPVLLDAELAGGNLWIGDVLHLDGADTRALPFRERRALLERLPLAGPGFRLAPVFPGGGPEVLAAAAQQGLPGVVAKRADSAYGQDWVEVATEPPPAPRSRPPTQVARARLTNPDKVLYPRTGTTKADVAAYYRAVADAMLPHLRDRPVTTVRWPDGVDRPSFFEKDVSRHAPPWIRTVKIDTPGSGRGSAHARFPLVDDVEGLVWAANLAALELHVPQWRVGPRGGRQRPDLLVFDLDPGEGTTVVDCARVAVRIAELLADDGLTALPRTSGGTGMQLYLPVSVSRDERTSAYARELAERLARDDPARVTAVMGKSRRIGKVLVDWSQNSPAKTTVAPYSLRGRPLPTVATPLTWEEVRAARHPEDLRFTLADVPARVQAHGDLLAPLLGPPQRLPR